MTFEYITVRVVFFIVLAASAVFAGLSENWHSLSAHALAAWCAFVAISAERKQSEQKRTWANHAAQYLNTIENELPSAVSEWSEGYSHGRMALLKEVIKVLGGAEAHDSKNSIIRVFLGFRPDKSEIWAVAVMPIKRTAADEIALCQTLATTYKYSPTKEEPKQ